MYSYRTILTLGVFSILSTSALLSGPHYQVIGAGALNQDFFNSELKGVNEHGVAVGSSYGRNFENYPVLFKNGTLTNLGKLPGSSGGEALSINASEQVCGFFQFSSYQRAFVWDAAQGLRELPSLDGNPTSYTMAFSINDAGQVAGYSGTANGSQAVIWDFVSGNIQALAALPGGLSHVAYDINQLGSAAGTASMNGSNPPIPATWDALGSVNPLGNTGFDWSGAYAINDHGVCVGYGQFPVPVSTAELWDVSGQAKKLLPPQPLMRGTSYYAVDINSDGIVIGNATSSFIQIPVLWKPQHQYGTPGTDLNQLIVTPGWTLIRANAINDAGWIVGYAFNPNGETEGFLLRPVH